MAVWNALVVVLVVPQLCLPTTHHGASKTYIAPCTSFVNIIMWVCYFSQGCATAIKVSAILSLSLYYNTLDTRHI